MCVMFCTDAKSYMSTRLTEILALQTYVFSFRIFPHRTSLKSKPFVCVSSRLTSIVKRHGHLKLPYGCLLYKSDNSSIVLNI